MWLLTTMREVFKTKYTTCFLEVWGFILQREACVLCQEPVGKKVVWTLLLARMSTLFQLVQTYPKKINKRANLRHLDEFFKVERNLDSHLIFVYLRKPKHRYDIPLSKFTRVTFSLINERLKAWNKVSSSSHIVLPLRFGQQYSVLQSCFKVQTVLFFHLDYLTCRSDTAL